MSPNTCSVVIPSYNHARFIERAVESVRAQSFKDYEIIIVDDGSSDGSIELLGTYNNTPGIRIIFQYHQGAHAAINQGVAASTGDYIAILNSDDICHAARIEKLLAIAGDTIKSFFAFTKIDFIDDAGLPCLSSKSLHEYAELLRHTERNAAANPFLHGNLAMTSSNFFFAKSLFSAVGPFRNLRYVHDWDWALRASAYVRPVFIDRVLLSYRLHPGNTLNEQDQWRHLLENAFIFASFLKNGLQSPNNDTQAACRTYFQTLLKNENFLPVLVLFFTTLMSAGTADEEILEKINNNFFADNLSSLIAEAGIPFDSLLSMNHLSRKLGPVNQAWAVFKNIFPSLARQFTYKK